MLLITAFCMVLSGCAVPRATGALATTGAAARTFAADTGAVDTGATGCKNDSTSAAVTRPLGPVPVILAKSRPLSLAMRLALGDTICRPDDAGSDLRGEDTTTSGIAATAAAVGEETNLASGSSDCGEEEPFWDADCPAAFCLASAISSLVSATYAIAEPTGADSPAGVMITPR